MSQYANIQEINTRLSNQIGYTSLVQYFDIIRNELYPNLNISFMKYFLELCSHKYEFIVNAIKLKEYGVLTNIDTSKDIKNRLNGLCLEIGTDYTMTNIKTSLKGKRGGATRGKNEYNLTPEAFKLCLIRSRNTLDYAKYYLLLEGVFDSYRDYQNMYKDNIINRINSENGSLHAKLDDMKNANKKQLDDLKDGNNELKDKIDDLKDDVENLTDKVEEVRDEFRENTEHISPPPENDDDIHMFVVLQYPKENNKFKIIRGQNKHLDKVTTENMNIIIDKRYHPNPIDMMTAVRDKVRKLNKNEIDKIRIDFKDKSISREEKNDLLEDNKKNPAIFIHYNTIHINYKKITLNNFIDLINKCANLGKDTFIP